VLVVRNSERDVVKFQPNVFKTAGIKFYETKDQVLRKFLEFLEFFDDCRKKEASQNQASPKEIIIWEHHDR